MKIKNTLLLHKSNKFKSKTHNYHGFTLVELIVVITILVILGTIAFTSLGGYSGSARDSSRVSDLVNISKSLDIAFIKTGIYPSPDTSFAVTYSGGILWHQGAAGDSVISILSSGGAKMSKKPTDPLYATKEYTYSRLAYGNAYQLKADYEGDRVTYGENPFFIHQVYAASGNPTLTYIKGTYNGMVAKTQTGGITYLLAVPSIITSQTGTVNQTFDIISTLSNKLLVHGQTNSGGVVYTTKLAYSSGALPGSDSERTLFSTNLALAYSGTILASNTSIQPFITALQTNNTGSLAILGGGLVSTGLGGATVSVDTDQGGGTPASLCGASNGQAVASTGFSGSLCAAGSNVISYAGKGGTATGSTLSWTCRDVSNSTESCSAVYNKPATGTGGQSCDTYDQFIGSLTGSYAVWSMCNMGAYTAYANQVITDCGGGTSDCDTSIRYAIGSYYQWGRNKDVTAGSTTVGPLVSDSTNNFILGVSASADWINPQNDNLWGGSGTVNISGTFLSQGSPAAMQGPCPTGYHVPTQPEWYSTIQSINPTLTSTDLFQDGSSIIAALKLPLVGYRWSSDATYGEQGSFGLYGTSSSNSIFGHYMGLQTGTINPLYVHDRAIGHSIRCLKN